jgi:pimeloyl-ACP methyl ester carboxylesterase
MTNETSRLATQPVTRAYPIWLDLVRPTFGFYHAPSGRSHSVAVLFCAPLGAEDICSYPMRREWARTLAEDGHPVLRFDLPGSGQSDGGPDDPQLLAQWVTAAAGAAAWLRDHSGATSVAAIGIGFGALLALETTTRGAAIDDLVLWGLPKDGRSLVRSMRAFSGLQDGASPDGDAAQPEGWMQMGGFMFSSETLADISSLRLDRPQPTGVRRALLLRAGGPSSGDERGAELLRNSGAEVTIADGPGYEEIKVSPHLAQFPARTIANSQKWLAAEQTHSTRELGLVPSHSLEVRIVHDGVTLRERPLEIETPAGVMFGILTEPADESASTTDPAIVFLPAMAERSIGPSRMWVDLARRHAARGLTTLRIDLLSIGDSEGDFRRMHSLDTIYDPLRAREVGAAMDALEAQTSTRQFLLIGLCSGGYWAMCTAIEDPRVTQVLLLNPSTPAETQTLLMRAAMRHPLSTFIDPIVHRRIREVGGGKMLDSVRRSLSRGTGPRQPRPMPTGSTVATVPRRFVGTHVSVDGIIAGYRRLPGVLNERGGRVTFCIGERDGAYWMLRAAGLLAGRVPGCSITTLDSHDHNLRSYSEQRAVRRVVDEVLAAPTPETVVAQGHRESGG